MQNLKRKLETLQTEEEAIHDDSAKRIRHLQDLYEIPSLVDVKYDTWSRTRLDRLMVDYLLRSGYSQTATALATSKQISHLIDLDTFIQCHKISSALSRGEVKEALVWVSENRNALKKLALPTSLEFELRLQQYIELARSGDISKRIEAIKHAQKYLAPHPSTGPSAMFQASALLAHSSSTTEEPYKTLFSAARWPYLSQLFVETHHTLLALPVRPLLHVALSAGLSALKTPACHSAYNPASSSTPGHARIATNHSLCPICSTELNELARSVPYAHHTKSYVESDAVVLPNGRIYGRERLEVLQKKLLGGAVGVDDIEIGKEGTCRDPTTGETFGWEEVRKVYIT